MGMMPRCAALLLAGAVCVSGMRAETRKTPQQERDGWTVSEAQLVEEAKTIDALYRSKGIDNNYLDYRVYDASTYASTFAAKFTENKVTVVESRSKQTDALRHCVFQTKGAYGEHFSNQKAWELAGLTTTRLRKASYITKIERLEGEDLFAWEIISAPCGVAVHDNTGKVLVMQGFGVD